MHDLHDVIKFLNDRELSVTTAESCTAGLVAAKMADVTGCGETLHSAYVVYTETAKQNCLGVNRETMDTFGLTSEEVAREMALGAFNKSPADIIIAITGTAESDDELNGLVCFAFLFRIEQRYHLISESKRFEGERNVVRNAAAEYALMSLPERYDQFTATAQA